MRQRKQESLWERLCTHTHRDRDNREIRKERDFVSKAVTLVPAGLKEKKKNSECPVTLGTADKDSLEVTV